MRERGSEIISIIRKNWLNWSYIGIDNSRMNGTKKWIQPAVGRILIFKITVRRTLHINPSIHEFFVDLLNIIFHI